jgi:hypothetical protein
MTVTPVRGVFVYLATPQPLFRSFSVLIGALNYTNL